MGREISWSCTNEENEDIVSWEERTTKGKQSAFYLLDYLWEHLSISLLSPMGIELEQNKEDLSNLLGI